MNPQDSPVGTQDQQVVERLRTAVNVLVTVSNSPSVDQLAAAIGFTLILNKMGKHATAVFSGDVPSTIEFLKPEATIEKNTDSLRDFIVSLDKSKADKLRYKVEENIVKIFITPYRTSLSEKDLNFSQGDFNVDAVVALGVSEREQLDQAIVAHGRILHDATVITISAGGETSSLGAINWQDPTASSLCEMLVGVADALQSGMLDSQIATAYLTGIVARTARFSNDKTTPKIMTLAAQLMAAGANQQLIANELDQILKTAEKSSEPAANNIQSEPSADTNETADGSLTIEHEEAEKPEEGKPEEATPEEAPAEDKKEEPVAAEIAIDEHGNFKTDDDVKRDNSGHLVLEPLSDQEKSNTTQDESHLFTANVNAESEIEPSNDPLSVQTSQPPILDHEKIGEPEKTDMLPLAVPEPATEPEVAAIPEQSVGTIPPTFDTNTLHDLEVTMDSQHIVKDPSSTLNEIEEVVGSPHVNQAAPLDNARDAVQNAIAATPYDPNRPEPMQALNAAPVTISEPVQPVLPPTPVSAPVETPQQQDPSGQSPPPVPPPMFGIQ